MHKSSTDITAWKTLHFFLYKFLIFTSNHDVKHVMHAISLKVRERIWRKSENHVNVSTLLSSFLTWLTPRLPSPSNMVSICLLERADILHNLCHSRTVKKHDDNEFLMHTLASNYSTWRRLRFAQFYTWCMIMWDWHADEWKKICSVHRNWTNCESCIFAILCESEN